MCQPGFVSRESSAARPSWLKRVRTSAAAGDGFEGLAEIVGKRVGGGDGLPSGLDLDGAVAAGCLDGASPATALAALATCSSIPCRVRRARSALYR
jgi:hypothetical protein